MTVNCLWHTALAVFFVLCAVTGCASPSGRYDATARTAGDSEHVVKGQRFHHKIYRNAVSAQNGMLHVFIEGDVSVRQALDSSPPDPTPRKALMLRMMQDDSSAAILLGRPCYHGLYVMDACEIRHLGPERYSEEIVASMLTALEGEMRTAGAGQVVLIGYSGGGALAMLLAARLRAAVALVTLAGNLDNAALITYHHSPALTGSLDPADMASLPRAMRQLHFFGGRDEEVPVELARKTLTRQDVAPIIIPGFDHDCCWEGFWPVIRSYLDPVLQRPSTNYESHTQ